MKKNRIRLTEAQLHQVIKESVKNILKEYEWNNKTPEQDQAAIKAANTPASWKAHMMRANNQLDRENGYYNNKVGKLANKANDAFHDQYGTRYDYHEDNFDNGGGNSNTIRGTITRVNPNGARLAVNQRDLKTNGERYHEKTYGDFGMQNMQNLTPQDYQNGYVNGRFGGSRNIWGQQGNGSEALNEPQEEHPSTRNQRYLSMSPQFRQHLTNIDNDLNDYYSGNYANRINQKRQQMQNK